MKKPKIEKNIPLDESEWSWLDELEIGDSFVVPSKFRSNVRNQMYKRKMIPVMRRIGDRASRENQNFDDWQHRFWFAGRSDQS
tara:strand:+ start:1988 stop:2236 length:249 start_codon:yes stop_codon:yes gene_type:complete